ncbi:hypothetical protein SMU72_05560 [Streptococcus mutans NLML9]|nr:hypothetical protein SMU72_05560 [Streptococcus mutans NLML9]
MINRLEKFPNPAIIIFGDKLGVFGLKESTW